MAISIIASDGTGGNKTSETVTSIVFSPSTALAVDDVVVVLLASDNAGTSGVGSYAAIGSLSSGALSWESARTFNRTAGSVALDGATITLLVGRVTTAIPAGATQNVHWSPATIAKAWRVLCLRGATPAQVNYVTTAGSSSSLASTVGNTPRLAGAGDIIIAAAAVESAVALTVGDTDTTNGTWAAFLNASSGGSGSDNTKMALGVQTKLVTASGAQQWNATSTNTDYALAILTLGESANRNGSAIVSGGGRVTVAPASSRSSAAVVATGGGVVTRTAAKGGLFVPPPAGVVGNQYRSTVMGTPGLVSYWRLGQAAGAALDEMGANNGTRIGPIQLVPGAIADGDGGVIATAANCTVAITAPSAALNALADVVTVEAWINRDGAAPGGWGGIVAKGAGAFYLRLNQTNGQLSFVKDRVVEIAIGPVGGVPTTGWHHVVATKDGSTVRLYIDGLRVTDVTTGTTFTASTAMLFFGSDNDANFGGQEPFIGSMDEIAIYDRAISAGEVQAHFSAAAPTYREMVLAEPGLVSYWRLGEPSGLSAADSKGTNNGSYVGGPTLGTPARIGDGNTAVALNGTSQFVVVGDSASLDVGDVFTCELWAKLNNVSAEQLLVSKGSGGIYFGVTGGTIFIGKQAVAIICNTAGLLSTGVWYHVVWTKDGSTNRTYLNGVDVTNLSQNPQTISNTSEALNIGRSSVNSGFVNGTLDEAAIYNVALTPAQVMAHYTAGPRYVLGTKMFTDTPPSAEAYDATTVGNRFTVNAAGEITAITYWHHSGDGNFTHYLGIYNGAGTKVVTYDDLCGGAPTGWRTVQLPTPLVVAAGETYTVSAYHAGWYYGYHAVEASLTPGLTFVGPFYLYGANGFPSAGSSPVTYTVDVVYHSTVVVSGSTISGGGVVTYAAVKAEAHFGSARLTGGGVVTPAGRAGRSTSQILTGGGIVTPAVRAGRSGARILTGSGAVASAGRSGRFVSLAGVGAGAPESMHAVDTPPSSYAGDYTQGMSFTPTVAGTVTHIRYWHHAGGHASQTHALSIWTMAGVKLATVGHPEGALGWHDVALPTPLAVEAGVSYVVSVGAFSYGYYSTGYPASLAPHLTAGNDGRYVIGQDLFPTTVQAANHYPIDVVFAPGVAGAITGGGVVTIAYRLIEAKTGSAIISGGGRVTAAQITGRRGSAIVTGSGVVVPAVRAGRAGSGILTGSGVVNAARVAGRRIAAILTGGGVVTSTRTAGRRGSAIVTGGGRVFYAFSILEARSGFASVTGGGRVAGSSTTARKGSTAAVGGGVVRYAALAQTAAGVALAPVPLSLGIVTPAATGASETTLPVLVLTTSLISPTVSGAGATVPDPVGLSLGIVPAVATGASETPTGTVGISLSIVVPLSSAPGDVTLPVLGLTATPIDVVTAGAANSFPDPIVLGLTVPGVSATVPINEAPEPVVLALTVIGATAGGGAVPFRAGAKAYVAADDLRAYVEADDLRAIVTGDTAHATIVA